MVTRVGLNAHIQCCQWGYYTRADRLQQRFFFFYYTMLNQSSQNTRDAHLSAEKFVRTPQCATSTGEGST